jgi:hypothetical protein
MTTKTDPWLMYAEVLAEVRVARSTLDDWRRAGRGPIFKRLDNGELRIHLSDLKAWKDALPDAV